MSEKPSSMLRAAARASSRLISWGALAAAVFTFGVTEARALADYPTRTQTLELEKGWNAVYLEVEPMDTAPAKVFAGTPVDVAAQFLRPVRTSQFATDPNEILANQEGWGIWYGPEREEGFLSNLFAIHSHTAYLVHSREKFTWRVTGQVFLKRIYWKPDSFNLVGFPVSEAAKPTFAEYFRGVPAHDGKAAFRLVNGAWRKIDRPAETVMRRGEAYWVYSEGGSDYQGPFDLRLFAGDHLRYFNGQFTATFFLRNRSTNPVSVTIIQESEGIPLDFIFKGLLETGSETFAARLPQSYAMPAIEADYQRSVTLRVHDSAAVAAAGASLLRISSDAGTEYWVAAYAEAAERP